MTSSGKIILQNLIFISDNFIGYSLATFVELFLKVWKVLPNEQRCIMKIQIRTIVKSLIHKRKALLRGLQNTNIQECHIEFISMIWSSKRSGSNALSLVRER